MRKVFLENLPHKGKLIDWKNSAGYKVPFIYEDIKGEVEIIYYDKTTRTLTIKYNDKEFQTFVGNFQKGQLGYLLNKINKEFKIEIGQTFKDNKRDLVIIDRKIIKDKHGRGWKMYKYKCNKCGFDCGEHYNIRENKYKYEYWIKEHHLLHLENCACCCASPHIIVEGINDIPTTAPWMIKYFQGGYDEAKKFTKSSSYEIKPICPYCRKIKSTPITINHIYSRKNIGCNCEDGCSLVSKIMFDLLNQLKENNIINNFETEKRFDWCKYYNPYKNRKSFGIYDFVLEDKKLIIETDGEFHRKDNLMNGQTKEESQWIDNIKDNLANKNGYKIIRISDEGSIKENILHSELNKIFDLSNIDWNKCLEYSYSNLVKEVCEYWNLHNEINNENLTTRKLGEIFGLNDGTIRTYLKRGTELNWCNYNPKEEMKKSALKNRNKPKQVEIFKNGISLGIFNNCTELIKQSETLFNVELTFIGISRVVNGKQKTHKGFTFKYI